jgi:hypothetical protein
MNDPRKDGKAGAAALPAASPEPGCNAGYAEDKPANRAQARIPGARPEPDAEEGGLEHDPDPDA